MPRLLVSIFVTLLLALPRPASAVAPAAAGAMSVVPGLGQVAAGNALEGFAWFGTVVGLSVSSNIWANRVGLELWEYNIYDAYRDAGAKDTGKQAAIENELAFLNPANLVDPISLGIVGYGVYSGTQSKNVVHQGPRGALGGALFFSTVGLGEEGLFRGFLFPAFSHLTGNYVAGALLSSAAFAAAHLVNKSKYYHSSAGLATIFTGGLLLCFQTYQHKWDLRHSIFTHAWFDFSVEYANIGAPGLSLANSVPAARFNLDF